MIMNEPPFPGIDRNRGMRGGPGPSHYHGYCEIIDAASGHCIRPVRTQESRWIWGRRLVMGESVLADMQLRFQTGPARPKLDPILGPDGGVHDVVFHAPVQSTVDRSPQAMQQRLSLDRFSLLQSERPRFSAFILRQLDGQSKGPSMIDRHALGDYNH